MEISITLNGTTYKVDQKPNCIAIPLQFNGPQPNHFGSPRATAKPWTVEGFVGDTKQGGSCNVSEIQMIPHCNGTHTETVNHIVHQDVFITEYLNQSFIPSTLITVSPCQASETNDSYLPKKQSDDLVITESLIEQALSKVDDEMLQGLIVRTLPNDDSKKTRCYSEDCLPPYFTIEATEYLLARKVKHLLVDFPSVDKTRDEGKMIVHHKFWNVTEDSHELNSDAQVSKTITEMVYVPKWVSDGAYLLNLQIPAFMSDAAPSRPMLYSMESK